MEFIKNAEEFNSWKSKRFCPGIKTTINKPKSYPCIVINIEESDPYDSIYCVEYIYKNNLKKIQEFF
jgi:hypothetical protein